MYNNIYEDLSNFSIKNLKKTKIKLLNKLGISTLYDLVYFFPRTFENRAKFKKINDLLDGENVIIEGKVVDINKNFFSKKKLTKVLLSDGEGIIELLWFNSPYVSKQIEFNDFIQVSGKVRKNRTLQLVNPSYRKKNLIDKNIDVDKLDPIYPLTNGLTQKEMFKIMEETLNKYGIYFQENLPCEYIVENKLMDRKKSIFNIHFPTNKEIYEEAKKRILYEEALVMELKILKSKYLLSEKNNNMYFLKDNKNLVKKYISSLPFELTDAQKKVISEIYKELKSGKIINRLLQGDVGSGKTVVAMILLLYMAENSYQGVIMAPTEILAKQHYLEVINQFSNLDINVEILTGSLTKKKKESIYLKLINGEIDILIGTHSLLEDDVRFKNLGLIIVDEQHKFGVDQRNRLRDKGIYSNMIVMSATPIPRSLALSIYGDLDVSIINSMPKGRKPIKTKWIKNDVEKNIMHSFIKNKLKEGRQAYVVSPLIEESDKLNLSSATETFEKYSEIYKEYKLGLLHGKMNNKEKEKVMEEFKNGEIDILISTTVVEVGVNVPNSSIIVILNSERFGLSSLHQLRGRVGRGEYSSYCFLVSSSESENAKKRMEVMEKTLDGFKIAEEDLRIRDTGEIFGLKQSGLSELKFLDIVSNYKEILIAKNFATKYLDENKGIIVDKYLNIDINKKY